MARPIQLKPGGPLYLKERLPSDLAKLKGQTVTLLIGDTFAQVTVGEFVQASLRTKDKREAKELHAQADAALRSYWDAERRGPIALTAKPKQSPKVRIIPKVSAKISLDSKGKLMIDFSDDYSPLDKLFMLSAMPQAAHDEQRRIGKTILPMFKEALAEAGHPPPPGDIA